MELSKNKLRVLHYPSIPCEAFFVDVKDEFEAKKIMNTLADQHLWLYDKGHIDDYSNSLMVVMWEDPDGEGESEWVNYFNHEEEMDWDEFDEAYLTSKSL